MGAMRGVGTLLFQECQRAMQASMSELQMQTSQSSDSTKLEEAIQKVWEAVQQLQREGREVTASIDFAPIREEIRNSEILRLETHKELVELIKDRFKSLTSTEELQA